MIIPTRWSCELCGKEFDTPYAVRDQVVVMNGEDDRAYPYVCSKCIKSLVSTLDELFPKNKYAVRAKEKQLAYSQFQEANK